MRMHPPGSDDPYDGNSMAKFMEVDNEYIKNSNSKRGSLDNRLD